MMNRSRLALILITLSMGVLCSSLVFADSINDQAQKSLRMLGESLQNLQKSDGTWVGPLEADPSADLMPLLLSKSLGLKYPNLEEETLHRIFKGQDAATGLWSAYPGGPARTDVTGMIVYSLKFVNPSLDENDPRLSKAWAWIHAQKNFTIGGLNRLIAVFPGVWPDDKLKKASPIFLELPAHFPVNIMNAGFLRTGLIPAIVWEYYKRKNLKGHPSKAMTSERLASGGRLIEKPELKPHSEEFMAQEGLSWILKHQQNDGTWAGALQITYFCMFTLHEAQLAGVGNYDAEIQHAWEGLMGWRAPVPEGYIIQQSTVGPVMDTARVLTAFAAAPTNLELLSTGNADHAIKWLLDHQIFSSGDWQVLAKNVQPGGWTFEYSNDAYPDIDDTAMVLEALAKVQKQGLDSSENQEKIQISIDRGLQWLLGIQNKNGGFPTWDRGTSSFLDFLMRLRKLGLPDVADRSQVDITSRTLKSLSALRELKASNTQLDLPISRACKFLLSKREKIDNAPLKVWAGEWMVDYIYGSSEATDALLASHCWQPDDAESTIKWLISKQNTDGGFGESPESYVQHLFVPADSSLSQTEFVLNALIDYESARDKESSADEGAKSLMSARAAIDAGIRFMIQTIGENPRPDETTFTGVFVRKIWYGRYLLLPHYEAVRVLGKYLQLSN